MRFTIFTYAICCFLFGCINHTFNSTNEKREHLSLSEDSLFFPWRSGYRRIIVEGDQWRISEIRFSDSVCMLTNSEKRSQNGDCVFYRNCDWITIKKGKDYLDIFVDGNNHHSQDFKIKIENTDTCIVLKAGLNSTYLSGYNSTDFIGLPQRSVVFDYYGGDKEIETQCDLLWLQKVVIDNCIYPIPAQEWQNNVLNKKFAWLTINHKGKIWKITADRNKGNRARFFEITLCNGEQSDKIVGVQNPFDGMDITTFSPSQIIFPLTGGKKVVDIPFQEWHLDKDISTLPYWLKINDDVLGKCILTTSPNYDCQLRKFILRFKKGKCYQYLEIIQSNEYPYCGSADFSGWRRLANQE